MGSDGCGSGGVTVEEVEVRESDRVSMLVGPSIEACTSFRSKKEPTFWNKAPDAELYRPTTLPSSFHSEEVTVEHSFGSTSSSLLLMPEAKQLQRRSGKIARNSSGFSKRSRMAHMEVSGSEPVADDIKGTEPVSYPAKCIVTDKSQTGKQKNNLNAKRGDKRNGKVLKGKYDSFSLKNGLGSFNSAAGGNNILGAYGSKPDIFDVTQHVSDLSLNALLDGTYKCPSLAKEKGKKVANVSENILHSVRKVCSVLQLRKPVHPQNSAESDNSCNRKASTCLVSSGSIPSKTDGDKGDTCAADLSTCNKDQDSCSKLQTPSNILGFPLYQPNDILERLELPLPKDLDSLLLDASKPVLSARNITDQRLGKPLSHRAGLPPFPWSHTSCGNYKSSADATKLSTSRSTCQGRWVKVLNTLNYHGGKPGFLVELESMTYNHSLVPSRGLMSGLSEVENAKCTSASLTSCERGSSSSATCSALLVPSDGHYPTLFAAAQTLCDIAKHSLTQSPHGMIKFLTKPSQNVTKVCKPKTNEKSEKIIAAPKSARGPDNLVHIADVMLPSKKLRLSVDEKYEEFGGQIGTTRKGPINWSTPRSSRSSPSKSLKDSIAETKHYNSSIVKKSFVMSPSTSVLDKACSSQQKPRKVMPVQWNRQGGKLE